jgi:glycosyltransferase involved in cell wall biosynthesis
MRILFRHLDPGLSGAVSSICKLLEAYCARFPDDRLTIMCCGESPLATLQQRFDNVEAEAVPSGAFREICRMMWGAHGVRVQSAREHYDVIWCLNVGPYVNTAVPQVLSIHNAFQIYPWQMARYHPGTRPQVAALRWFFRMSLRRAHAAIVQTDLMKEYVQRINGCPRKVVVLRKAVVSAPHDTGHPLPAQLQAALRKGSGVLTLLYVATFSPHKNHGVLSAMMEICRSRGAAVRLVVTLDTTQWCVVGGPASESLMRSGHVIPIGWIPKDQLFHLYASCDVCVMPSLLESLSSAHIEAMQWRKPQIVADLPYAHDLCGEAALYAGVNDPMHWVSTLELLQSDPALRDRLVTLGAERLLDFPETWKDMAEELRHVFTDVVGGHNRGNVTHTTITDDKREGLVRIRREE